MDFDHIHPIFSLTTSRFIPQFSSPPKKVPFFLKRIWALFLLHIYSWYWFSHWSMVNLSGSISLKETGSPSQGRHKLSVATQLQMGSSEFLPATLKCPVALFNTCLMQASNYEHNEFVSAGALSYWEGSASFQCALTSVS